MLLPRNGADVVAASYIVQMLCDLHHVDVIIIIVLYSLVSLSSERLSELIQVRAIKASSCPSLIAL